MAKKKAKSKQVEEVVVSNTADTKRKHQIKLLIVALFAVFSLSQGWMAWSDHKTYEIQQESYITNLQASYQSALRECLQLSQAVNQNAEEGEAQTEQEIQTSCVTSVNDQRIANLLREHGHADLLEQL